MHKFKLLIFKIHSKLAANKPTPKTMKHKILKYMYNYYCDLDMLQITKCLSTTCYRQ